MTLPRASLHALERLPGAGDQNGEVRWQLIALLRSGALVVVGVLLLSGTVTDDMRIAWLSFAGLAMAASLIHRRFGQLPALVLIGAESLAAAVLMSVTAAPAAPALGLYLLVPAFWAGFALRLTAAMAVALIASAVPILIDLAAGSGGGTFPPVVSWMTLNLLAASLGAWYARIQHDRRQDDAAYEKALGLLQELHSITRRLPVGLDRSAILSQGLGSVREIRPEADAWIYLSRSAAWGPELGTAPVVGGIGTPGTSAWDRAMRMRHVVVEHTDADGGDTVTLIPLLHRSTVVGMLRMATEDSLTKHELRNLQERLSSIAVRLLSATVFTQIREAAIAEERSRVSRQIHDGVAQDLAGLAFSLDAISYGMAESQERAAVTQSASDVRRLVEELRFSIFDLRAGVAADESLGTVLAGHVQQVGERSGMLVHVEVDDRVSAALPPHKAHELLRIAQEAVTNARRHSGAGKLWVVLRLTGESVLLRVADDGAGIGPSAHRSPGDHVGLAIMHERAERLAGTLTLRRRVGGGTVLECRIPATGAVTARVEAAESWAHSRSDPNAVPAQAAVA